MKKLLVLFFILSLNSCGTIKNALDDVVNRGNKPYKKVETDIEFIHFIKNFENDFNIEVTTPIIFGEIEKKDAAAVCMKWSDGYKQININKDYWQTLTYLRQLALIYHELGHCEKNLEHNDNHIIFDQEVCPESIMRSYVFNEREAKQCLNEYFDHYLQEMEL